METTLKICMIVFAIVVVLLIVFLITNNIKKTKQQGIVYDSNDSAIYAKLLASLMCLIVRIPMGIGMAFGMFLITHKHEEVIGYYIDTGEFIAGVVLLGITLFIPSIAEFILYSCFREKARISPLWYIVPTILMTALTIILYLWCCVDYIADWQNAVWK